MSSRGLRDASLFLALAASLALVVYTFVPSEPDNAWDVARSTYSGGPTGIEALFLLLSHEGLTTRRLRRPGYSSLDPGVVLWILAGGRVGAYERRELLTFVRRGGTVVTNPKVAGPLLDEAKVNAPSVALVNSTFLAEDNLTIEPGHAAQVMTGGAWPTQTFVESEDGDPLIAAWGIGNGLVVWFGAPELLENGNIGSAQNGIFLVHLARDLGPVHVFDELKTGIAGEGVFALLARAPYRAVLAQLALAGLVGLAAAGIRLLPVEPIQPERRRSTRDHVEAVGRLWARSRDPRLPLAALGREADSRAADIQGTTESFLEWVVRAKPGLAERASLARHSVERMCRLDARPSGAVARAAANELRAVERETQKW